MKVTHWFGGRACPPELEVRCSSQLGTERSACKRPKRATGSRAMMRTGTREGKCLPRRSCQSTACALLAHNMVMAHAVGAGRPLMAAARSEQGPDLLGVAGEPHGHPRRQQLQHDHEALEQEVPLTSAGHSALARAVLELAGDDGVVVAGAIGVGELLERGEGATLPADAGAHILEQLVVVVHLVRLHHLGAVGAVRRVRALPLLLLADRRVHLLARGQEIADKHLEQPTCLQRAGGDVGERRDIRVQEDKRRELRVNHLTVEPETVLLLLRAKRSWDERVDLTLIASSHDQHIAGQLLAIHELHGAPLERLDAALHGADAASAHFGEELGARKHARCLPEVLDKGLLRHHVGHGVEAELQTEDRRNEPPDKVEEVRDLVQHPLQWAHVRVARQQERAAKSVEGGILERDEPQDLAWHRPVGLAEEQR
mmetsp:Transcript_89464/g.230937  ORF Transcript_89464/g.230937 Transcript_89464/m.230937 type:complete len:428 (-) Transcript_89464:718-2001(-)